MSMASALSQLGKVTGPTRDKAEELWQYMHSRGVDLKRLWGMGPGDEHGVGRALDLMITGVAGSDDTAGDLIASYLWANRKRLGVKWIIWDRNIRSTTPGKSGKWEPYRGKSPHTDHVHVFFGTGAYVPPTPPAGGGGGDKGVAGWWHVDPRRVTSFLWGLKGGTRKNVKARPGRNIMIVREAKLRGKMWLITEHNNWFAKYYMNRGRS